MSIDCDADRKRGLVNFELVLAMRVVPDRVWRIITSDQHSTI